MAKGQHKIILLLLDLYCLHRHVSVFTVSSPKRQRRGHHWKKTTLWRTRPVVFLQGTKTRRKGVNPTTYRPEHTDVPAKHVPQLASILQFRPREDFGVRAKRISRDAKSLPSLLRPSRLERALLPPLGHLCNGLHKALDYSVVEVVLRHIQLEVGERLNNLIWGSELLSPEQIRRVGNLRALHALWLPRKEYEMTFLASTRDLKWRYQEDQCEACIVSRITGDMETLLDLLWVIRSRATDEFLAKRGNPRLHVWVHAWIRALSGHVAEKTGERIDVDAVIGKVERDARELMGVRTNIHELRKEMFKDVMGDKKNCEDGQGEKMKNVHPSSDGEDGDEVGDKVYNLNGWDAELEIINAYAATNSTLALSKGVASAQQYQGDAHSRRGHATVRPDTVSADPATKGKSPYRHHHRMPAQESWETAPVESSMYTITSSATASKRDLDLGYNPKSRQSKAGQPYRHDDSNASNLMRTEAARCPADTYVNLLDSPPFTSDRPNLPSTTMTTITTVGPAEDLECTSSKEGVIWVLYDKSAEGDDNVDTHGDGRSPNFDGRATTSGKAVDLTSTATSFSPLPSAPEYDRVRGRGRGRTHHNPPAPVTTARATERRKKVRRVSFQTEPSSTSTSLTAATTAIATTSSTTVWSGSYASGLAKKKELGWFYAGKRK
ncbi:hypothetical protein ABEF92_006717 [Exophiala dermatitidis]|uniref:Uncharacterized protein n=1 Tax=Exophiala dermatitidis (strain ATCC 34100 / CBS 525.76 / NIH/UT8656) TaxID=858893 RepID=H6C0G2_EXODN|nr:uncharacterized protein HMPREF1120_04472 [Exophiala dermatitidis NIH/UT8656]EHY56390.1 hypothetical protein HMPREF1120_04472 [Exophiala dermatitidis NIH/UT8656]